MLSLKESESGSTPTSSNDEGCKLSTESESSCIPFEPGFVPKHNYPTSYADEDHKEHCTKYVGTNTLDDLLHVIPSVYTSIDTIPMSKVKFASMSSIYLYVDIRYGRPTIIVYNGYDSYVSVLGLKLTPDMELGLIALANAKRVLNKNIYDVSKYKIHYVYAKRGKKTNTQLLQILNYCGFFNRTFFSDLFGNLEQSFSMNRSLFDQFFPSGEELKYPRSFAYGMLYIFGFVAYKKKKSPYFEWAGEFGNVFRFHDYDDEYSSGMEGIFEVFVSNRFDLFVINKYGGTYMNSNLNLIADQSEDVALPKDFCLKRDFDRMFHAGFDYPPRGSAKRTIVPSKNGVDVDCLKFDGIYTYDEAKIDYRNWQDPYNYLPLNMWFQAPYYKKAMKRIIQRRKDTYEQSKPYCGFIGVVCSIDTCICCNRKIVKTE